MGIVRRLPLPGKLKADPVLIRPHIHQPILKLVAVVTKNTFRDSALRRDGSQGLYHVLTPEFLAL